MVIIVFKISSSTKTVVLNIWRLVTNFSRYTPSIPSVLLNSLDFYNICNNFAAGYPQYYEGFLNWFTHMHICSFTAASAHSLRAFSPQAEGWVLES